MLLALFITFNCIFFALLIASIFTNWQILGLSAFTLMFLVGIPFLFGSGIEYKSATTAVVTGNTTVTTDNYTSYTNHWFAFFYEMTAVIGFVSVMVLGGTKDDDE